MIAPYECCLSTRDGRNDGERHPYGGDEIDMVRSRMESGGMAVCTVRVIRLLRCMHLHGTRHMHVAMREHGCVCSMCILGPTEGHRQHLHGEDHRQGGGRLPMATNQLTHAVHFRQSVLKRKWSGIETICVRSRAAWSRPVRPVSVVAGSVAGACLRVCATGGQHECPKAAARVPCWCCCSAAGMCFCRGR